MKPERLHNTRVLALDPCSKGFGFAVLEGPESLVDWGVKSASGDKNPACLKRVGELISLYQPDVVVVEDVIRAPSRRGPRVTQLIREIEALCDKKRVRYRRIAPAKIKAAFGLTKNSTKDEIASAVANHFPELRPRLPRPRKPWMGEDERMSIFDAVALALASF